MNPAAGMFTGIPTVIKNLLIINGLMFLLAAKLLDGFVVDGLLAGIIGSTLYSVISWLLSKLLLSTKS